MLVLVLVLQDSSRTNVVTLSSSLSLESLLTSPILRIYIVLTVRTFCPSVRVGPVHLDNTAIEGGFATRSLLLCGRATTDRSRRIDWYRTTPLRFASRPIRDLAVHARLAPVESTPVRRPLRLDKWPGNVAAKLPVCSLKVYTVRRINFPLSLPWWSQKMFRGGFTGRPTNIDLNERYFSKCKIIKLSNH